MESRVAHKQVAEVAEKFRAAVLLKILEALTRAMLISVEEGIEVHLTEEAIRSSSKARLKKNY